jgi:hypothetical protein
MLLVVAVLLLLLLLLLVLPWRLLLVPGLGVCSVISNSPAVAVARICQAKRSTCK